MSIEVWRAISGFEGRYEVSSAGRVRSLPRRVAMMKRNGEMGEKTTTLKILRLHTWGSKYPGIVLLDSDLKRHRRMVHQLVAEAFIPNPLGFSQVNHIDADTFNARVENLEWCDQSHNLRHAHRIGNRKTGKEHHFAVLPRDASGRCVAVRSGDQ